MVIENPRRWRAVSPVGAARFADVAGRPRPEDMPPLYGAWSFRGRAFYKHATPTELLTSYLQWPPYKLLKSSAKR